MPEGANILLADDDPNFVLLLRTAFEYAGLAGIIAAVADGIEAVRYLKGEGRFADRSRYPVPELVVLDLRLPRLSGFDVLRWIRDTWEFHHLPVIMLTGTEIQEECHLAMQEGASEFLIKPFEFGHLTQMAEHISECWMHAPHL